MLIPLRPPTLCQQHDVKEKVSTMIKAKNLVVCGRDGDGGERATLKVNLQAAEPLMHQVEESTTNVDSEGSSWLHCAVNGPLIFFP
jgi:hypothetical protein